ncbi:MAG: ATP-binding cassette domain-containing protein [Calditerrivibrio sp.]|nr:ATP-binding cassette domain-containing protein [Calditerrivibrio sp.]MCA1932886.1 ATP-binding cassette domain-containing protein [Calditerrivibrio sp.]MCA1979944.1 ATP-binding cassette domain-containing protein [Calditerrivibrio sp.]
MKNIVEIKNLSYKYPNEDDFALKDINITLSDKDYIVILGPNGGGKTTLLKLILGILKPTEGSVNIKGKLPEESYSSIGYVPQQINVKREFPITVRKVISLGLKGDVSKHRLEEKLESIVNELKLNDLLDKRVSELSGGQLQRVYLARAIISDPEILILDEPTSNIDPYGTFCFFSYLEKLNERMTIITVSHNLNIVTSGAKSVACVNKILLFNDKPVITKEMLGLMYGLHDAHSCHFGHYLEEEIEHIQHSMGGQSGNI